MILSTIIIIYAGQLKMVLVTGSGFIQVTLKTSFSAGQLKQVLVQVN